MNDVSDERKVTRQLLVIMTVLSAVLMALLAYFVHAAYADVTERNFFFYFLTGGLPVLVLVFVFRSILNLVGFDKK